MKVYGPKVYSPEEWSVKEGTETGGFDDRVYVDMFGNPITGILRGFYGFADRTEEENSQVVESGKRKL